MKKQPCRLAGGSKEGFKVERLRMLAIQHAEGTGEFSKNADFFGVFVRIFVVPE